MSNMDFLRALYVDLQLIELALVSSGVDSDTVKYRLSKAMKSVHDEMNRPFTVLQETRNDQIRNCK